MQRNLSAVADLESAVDLTGTTGFIVDDLDDDDPVLLTAADGVVVDTWRRGYPYDERLNREVYEADKRLLQIELLKVQNWVKATGRRLVIVFEGRDAAGKGGTIKRFMEHLNPRGARVEQRQETRPPQRDAPRAGPVRLREQGTRHRRSRRSAPRRPRPRRGRLLTPGHGVRSRTRSDSRTAYIETSTASS